MTSWTADELDRIGRADELRIASRRPDGSLRPYVTIWTVRSGDDIYVRSAHGWDNPWFQRALHSDAGRIQAGGVERDVAFEPTGPDLTTALHAAYHAEVRPVRAVDRRHGGLAGGCPIDPPAGAGLGLGATIRAGRPTDARYLAEIDSQIAGIGGVDVATYAAEELQRGVEHGQTGRRAPTSDHR